MIAGLLRPAGLLALAGRHGPALLCGGVLVGLVAPPLAELARPLMRLAVFVFTLGASLKVDAAAFRAELARRGEVLLVLGWVLFGVPLLTLAVVTLLPPGEAAATGLLLCALAPPVASAAAITAMLGLSAPLALLATVVATVLAPLTLPPLAGLLAGATLAIAPLELFARLLAIVGAAAGAAWLLRRRAGDWVAANPQAMTGISVAGLLLVAVGAMRGMQEQILAAPGQAAVFLALAFGANAGMQLAGALLFARLDRWRALTVGLVSGSRNVTLVWAAATPFLVGRPELELFLAAAVFPIFLLPAATRPLIERLLRGPGSPPRPDALLRRGRLPAAASIFRRRRRGVRPGLRA
jgi:BASS family bile acid:Na+ symporter